MDISDMGTRHPMSQTTMSQTEVSQTEVSQTEVSQTEVSQTEVSQTENTHVESVVQRDDDEYYAGLIDAQMNVTLSKSQQVRVVLTSHDPRVAEQLSAKFRPTRITIIKRPQKKDMCTILFLGEHATGILTFASTKCKIRNGLAAKTLAFMEQKATAEEIANVPLNEDIGTMSLDYASGIFDVRSIVTQTVPATESTKKKRGNVKVVVPKTEKFVIPELQRVLHGRVKKSSPCRLVYESNDMIRTLKDTVGGHVRAKKDDLMML